MLTDEERRRLEELSRAMNERPLTQEESAELGNLMALDMGASREPYQPPELRPRGGSGRERRKLRHKLRRKRR